MPRKEGELVKLTPLADGHTFRAEFSNRKSTIIDVYRHIGTHKLMLVRPGGKRIPFVVALGQEFYNNYVPISQKRSY